MPKLLRRLLGLILLLATIGVATCQSMFEAVQSKIDAPSSRSAGD